MKKLLYNADVGLFDPISAPRRGGGKGRPKMLDKIYL